MSVTFTCKDRAEINLIVTLCYIAHIERFFLKSMIYRNAYNKETNKIHNLQINTLFELYLVSKMSIYAHIKIFLIVINRGKNF